MQNIDENVVVPRIGRSRNAARQRVTNLDSDSIGSILVQYGPQEYIRRLDEIESKINLVNDNINKHISVSGYLSGGLSISSSECINIY